MTGRETYIYDRLRLSQINLFASALIETIKVFRTPYSGWITNIIEWDEKVQSTHEDTDELDMNKKCEIRGFRVSIKIEQTNENLSSILLIFTRTILV